MRPSPSSTAAIGSARTNTSPAFRAFVGDIRWNRPSGLTNQMGEPELPSLWAFGDPEPWRRGRVILITLALFHGVGQALVFLIALFGGDLETGLALAITLAL